MPCRPCRPRGGPDPPAPARWLHDTGRTGGPGHARQRLEAVGVAAAAAGLDVRILDGEAGTHHVVVDIVDLAAREVGRAVLVDVHLDAVRFDDVVIRGLLVFPAELVRHPGAAPAHDPDAQAPLGLAFFQAELADLLGGRLCHRDHAILPSSFGVSRLANGITGYPPRAGA